MAMLIYRRVVKNIESTTEIGQASMVSLWYQGWFTDVENWIDSWDKSALNPTCHFDPVQNYDTNGTTKASLLGSGFAVTCDLVLEQQKKTHHTPDWPNDGATKVANLGQDLELVGGWAT